MSFEDDEKQACDIDTTISLESDDPPKRPSKLQRLDSVSAYERVKMFLDNEAVEKPFLLK